MVHAEPVDGGGWDLDLEDGSIRHSDLLVVANGHHWDPRMAEFTGTEIHSHHYIDPQTPLDFTGRSILVVGLGNSTSPYLPLAWQRKAAQLGQPLLTGRPEPYGLPPRITASSKHTRLSRWNCPLRLGSGDLPPKPDIRRLDGRTVHFEDGTCGEFDVIVYATGYNEVFSVATCMLELRQNECGRLQYRKPVASMHGGSTNFPGEVAASGPGSA